MSLVFILYQPTSSAGRRNRRSTRAVIDNTFQPRVLDYTPARRCTTPNSSNPNSRSPERPRTLAVRRGRILGPQTLIQPQAFVQPALLPGHFQVLSSPLNGHRVFSLDSHYLLGTNPTAIVLHVRTQVLCCPDARIPLYGAR